MTATLNHQPVTNRAGHGMTVDIEDITPEVAERWLRANGRNRPLRNDYVHQLKRDMETGRFRTTGQGIQFAYTGELLDGQHRLTAIVLSGVTVRLPVVRGLEPEVQDVIDVGRKRTIADALHLEGLAKVRPGQLGSIARALLLVENAPTDNPRYRPTQAEVLDRVRAEQEEFEVAAYFMGRAQGAGLRGGMIYGLAFYTLAQKNRVAAHEFFEQLITGADLSQGSPVYALRRRLIKDPPRSPGVTATRLNLGLFIKAWNLWRKGKTAEVIRIGQSEKLPTPVG